MRKFYQILAWISGFIGILLMLLGIIALLSGNGLLGHFWSNFYYPAYNFLLLGIFFFLAVLVCKDKKE